MTTLNLIEMTEIADFFVFITLILFLLGVVLFVFGCVALAKDDEDGSKGVVFGLLCIFAFVILAINSDASIFQEPNGKFQIEATFSEDMPFLSVMNEYNIVEQRGDIFVLEPKEREVD